MSATTLSEVQTVWELGDLVSRCEGRPYTSDRRADPYWDGIFSTGSSDSWVGASLYRQMTQRTQRHSGIPDAFVSSRREALEALATNRHRASILTTLGAVDSWRSLTREQLAAIAGSNPLGQHFPDSLSAPFSAGLLLNGYVSAGAHRFAPRSQRMSMWSVGEDQRAFEIYSQTLTAAERISVLGGSRWTIGHRYDRHNALATELALRAAEYCDVATVIGEKHCAVGTLLASTGTPCEERDRNRRADLGIVRQDGMIVLVEVTASVNASFRAKIERWAQLLQRHPLYELPVALLVLDISTPQQEMVTPSGKRPARTDIRRAVSEAVSAYPGSPTNRTASRIAVASWNQWFPGRHLADESFLSLTADLPIGTGADRWQSLPLLDPFDVPAPDLDPDLAQTLTQNMRLVAGTPHWLRTGPRPDLAAWMLHDLESHGHYDLPLRTEVQVPERMTGAPLVQTVGGRRQAKLLR